MINATNRYLRSAPRVRAGGSSAAALGLLAIGAVLAAPAAKADTMELAQAGLVIGTQTTEFSLTTSGPGTLTVQLNDLDWPSQMADLNFSLTSATKTLDSLNAPGQTSLSIGGAGTYYAHLSGEAQGPLDIGAYSLSIMFTPLGAPVPLPPALGLLLGGLALLGALLGATSRPSRDFAPAPIAGSR